MRRFSQRGHLVTLSEINITPLLDLAFVLLIIFVITTPLLEQGLNLNLPQGGSNDLPLDRSDIRTVSVRADGTYRFREMDLGFAPLAQALVSESQANPDLVVYIRADKTTPFDAVFQLADLCVQNGIKISWRSEPARDP